MSLFAELLCKQMPNIDFPSVNYESITKLNNSWKYNGLHYISIKLVYYIYFLQFDNHHSQINHKPFLNKFHILETIILKNKMITQHEKIYFLKKFMIAQNHYLNFRKLAKIFKFKNYKKFEIDTDLCFTNFDKLSSNILITLMENNIIYKFRISDLINIINKSLSHSPQFFAEPYEIKNPYTNIPFSHSNLYNIYFRLKQTNYSIPILFHQYFITNFNLGKFKNMNECLIRDKSIDNFIKNGSNEEKYEYIMRMFYVHYKNIYFIVHQAFPRAKLVIIFNKYLLLFLLEQYSLNPYIRDINRIQLEYNLTLFSQLNPDFGKRVWVRKRRPQQSGLYYTFNDHVIEPSDLVHGSYSVPSDVLTALEHDTDSQDNDEQTAMDPENEDDELEAEEYEPETDSTRIQTLLRQRRNYVIYSSSQNDAAVDYVENVSSDDNETTNTPVNPTPRSLDNIFTNYET
jgi:hypothetical protein